MAGVVTHRDAGTQGGDILLALLQLLSCLVSLKLGLRLQMVKGVLETPVLQQELLPLQSGREREIYKALGRF